MRHRIWVWGTALLLAASFNAPASADPSRPPLPEGSCHSRQAVQQMSSIPGVSAKVSLHPVYREGTGPHDVARYEYDGRTQEVQDSFRGKTNFELVELYYEWLDPGFRRDVQQRMVANGMSATEASESAAKAARLTFLTARLAGIRFFKYVIIENYSDNPVLLVSKTLYDHGREVEEYCVADPDRNALDQMAEWNR